MSLSTQTTKRLPIIKAGLLKGLNYEQIGEKCGVTEKTIDRDVSKWVDSGQFETWIREEWLRLHNIIIHEAPIEAYKQLTKLLGHTLTRKMEIQKEVKTEHRTDIHILLERYEDVIERAADRNLPENHSPKPLHPPRANT